jgi:hypothetical protein
MVIVHDHAVRLATSATAVASTIGSSSPEDQLTCGFGAELAARIAGDLFRPRCAGAARGRAGTRATSPTSKNDPAIDPTSSKYETAPKC